MKPWEQRNSPKNTHKQYWEHVTTRNHWLGSGCNNANMNDGQNPVMKGSFSCFLVTADLFSHHTAEKNTPSKHCCQDQQEHFNNILAPWSGENAHMNHSHYIWHHQLERTVMNVQLDLFELQTCPKTWTSVPQKLAFTIWSGHSLIHMVLHLPAFKMRPLRWIGTHCLHVNA